MVRENLYKAALICVCSPNSVRQNKSRCKQNVHHIPERQWTLCNNSILSYVDITDEDLRLSLSALATIEHTTTCSYQGCWGPLTILTVVAAVIGLSTKMHYVLNRTGSVHSFDGIGRIRCLVSKKVQKEQNRALSWPPSHDVGVFSIDNLYRSDNYGLSISGRDGRDSHGLQIIIAKQGVFTNVRAPKQKFMKVTETDLERNHMVLKSSLLWTASFHVLMTSI